MKKGLKFRRSHARSALALGVTTSVLLLAGCVTHVIDTFSPEKIKERKTPFKAYSGAELPSERIVSVRTWFEKNYPGDPNHTISNTRILSIDGIDVSTTKSNFIHVLPGVHKLKVSCTPGPRYRIQHDYKDRVVEMSISFTAGSTFYAVGELQTSAVATERGRYITQETQRGVGTCIPQMKYVAGFEEWVHGW